MLITDIKLIKHTTPNFQENAYMTSFVFMVNRIWTFDFQNGRK